MKPRRAMRLGIETLEKREVLSGGVTLTPLFPLTMPQPSTLTSTQAPTPARSVTLTLAQTLTPTPAPTSPAPDNGQPIPLHVVTPVAPSTIGNYSPKETQSYEDQGYHVWNLELSTTLSGKYVAVSSADGSEWFFVPVTPTRGSTVLVQDGSGDTLSVSSDQDLKNDGFTLVSYPDGNQWYVPPRRPPRPPRPPGSSGCPSRS